MEWIHPGMVILLGGLLIPFIRWRKVKLIYFLLLPVAGFVLLLFTSVGVFGVIPPWSQALLKWQSDFWNMNLF